MKVDSRVPLAALSADGGHWQLRFETNMSVSRDRIFKALTDAKELSSWFPTDIEGERVQGAELRFVFRFPDAPVVPGTLLEWNPPRTVEYEWAGERLRFTLTPFGAGTKLECVSTFDGKGRAARDAAGWHSCLELLMSHLDRSDPPWTPVERWAQVYPLYVEHLGPEAATADVGAGTAPGDDDRQPEDSPTPDM